MTAFPDLFDLRGKTALVTGASSGMGRAIALALGQHGATVLVVSHDAAGCASVVRELVAQGNAAHALVCDLTEVSQVRQLYADALAQVPRVDVLVQCVGVALAGSLLAANADDFAATFALNVQHALLLSQLFIPQMQARRDGVLLYLASLAGLRGNRNLGLYSLSKAALLALARNLAVEFGPDNIRANTISPGVIDTPFAQPLLADEALKAKRLALTPLRRVGQPEEVAGVAVLLASRAGGFITGQNIVVDGGTLIGDGS